MSAPFVIVGTQRTGTTLVRTSLDSHPDITCHGEVFKEGRLTDDSYEYYCRSRPVRMLGHYFSRQSSVDNFLDTMFSRSAPKCVGFKLMYSHARRFPETIRYISRRRVPAVHVVRHNHLRTLVSRELSRQTGVYHRTRLDEVPGIRSVKLDAKRTLELLASIALENRAWEQMLYSVTAIHRVSYEDFAEERDSTSSEILRFLGLEPQKLDSELTRINAGPLNEIIENYNEVRTALEGTEYAGMFREDWSSNHRVAAHR